MSVSLEKLYLVAKKSIECSKYSFALGKIKKAYKVSNLAKVQRHAFLYLELVCYVKTENLIKAERLVKENEKSFSFAQQLQICHLLGGFYASNEEYADSKKAIYYLEKSITIDSSINNANAYNLLHQMYSAQYDLVRADDLWLKLSKWEKYFPKVAMKRLEASYRLNFTVLANDTLDFLVKNYLQIPLGNFRSLIYFLFTSNREEEAKKLLNSTRQDFVNSQGKAFLESTMLFEKKLVKECLASLTHYKTHYDASYHLMAQCHDKLKNYDKAFNFYQQSAESVLISNKGRTFENVISSHQNIDFAKLYIEKVENYAIKKLSVADREVNLSFMIGFPRSGTTLLENILDSQDEVYTLAELGNLNPLFHRTLLMTGDRYPIGLPKLTRVQIKELRNEYVNTLGNILQSKVLLNDKQATEVNKIKMVVDKMPLNSINLPFINMLFPKVKIIFSLRHPLDVVLSNFQQFYSMNREMSFLVSLENCVDRYIEVMDHVKRCEEEFDLNIHYIKYENLVVDFDDTAEGVFKFLAINFDENYKSFNRLAKNKLINTPSRLQVNEKIYSSSTFKWKNYSQHIAPHIDRLKPYIERFGYDV